MFYFQVLPSSIAVGGSKEMLINFGFLFYTRQVVSEGAFKNGRFCPKSSYLIVLSNYFEYQSL